MSAVVVVVVVVCTMEGSSMVDGRERDIESDVQVCECVRVSVGAALLCGGRCGEVVGSRF